MRFALIQSTPVCRLPFSPFINQGSVVVNHRVLGTNGPAAFLVFDVPSRPGRAFAVVQFWFNLAGYLQLADQFIPPESGFPRYGLGLFNVRDPNRCIYFTSL